MYLFYFFRWWGKISIFLSSFTCFSFSASSETERQEKGETVFIHHQFNLRFNTVTCVLPNDLIISQKLLVTNIQQCVYSSILLHFHQIFCVQTEAYVNACNSFFRCISHTLYGRKLCVNTVKPRLFARNVMEKSVTIVASFRAIENALHMSSVVVHQNHKWCTWRPSEFAWSDHDMYVLFFFLFTSGDSEVNVDSLIMSIVFDYSRNVAWKMNLSKSFVSWAKLTGNSIAYQRKEIILLFIQL